MTASTKHPFVRCLNLSPKMLLLSWFLSDFLLKIFRAKNMDHYGAISGVPRVVEL